MPEPTKADLAAAVARLTEEKAALLDIFAAVREASDKGKDSNWIVGYVGGIGKHPESLNVLRMYAADVRGGGREGFPAPSAAQGTELAEAAR